MKNWLMFALIQNHKKNYLDCISACKTIYNLHKYPKVYVKAALHFVCLFFSIT